MTLSIMLLHQKNEKHFHPRNVLTNGKTFDAGKHWKHCKHWKHWKHGKHIHLSRTSILRRNNWFFRLKTRRALESNNFTFYLRYQIIYVSRPAIATCQCQRISAHRGSKQCNQCLLAFKRARISTRGSGNFAGKTCKMCSKFTLFYLFIFLLQRIQWISSLPDNAPARRLRRGSGTIFREISRTNLQLIDPSALSHIYIRQW